MKNYYLSSLFVFGVSLLFGQTVVNHDVDFNSGSQNMWGPSFNAFTLDQEITIFEVNWNESGGTGNGGIVTILGQQFGGAISGTTSGTIGAKFTIEGFTSGEVEVDYPVRVEVTKPDDDSFNSGEMVSLETDYSVRNGYRLQTTFPNAGEARLDLYFQMFFNVNATLCMFACVNFDIIPPLSIPYTNFNIFTINQNGITFFGPGCPWDPMSGLSFTPPYSLCDGCPVQCIPGQVEVDFFPLELPDNDLGFSGEFTIPHVVTDYSLDGTDLVAVGDSTYVTLSLEIFKFLGNFLPPPVGPVLANLSNEYTLPDPFGSIYGASAFYTLFSASFNAFNTTHQRFRFSPTLYGKYTLPTPVNFSVYDTTNALVSSGFGNIIDFTVGHRIDFRFPCHYDSMSILPIYSIDPTFSNHTYDEISFSFSMEALAFGINLPGIVIVPQICVPEICIPIPYPCPTWRRPWRWCTRRVCTPAFCTPEIGFPGWSIGIGPLWEDEFPIGALPPITYFNQTWTLEGFTPQTADMLTLKARPFLSNSTHSNILCYGETTGSIDVTLTNGTAPYTYTWNNGASTEDITDLGAGNYHATIYDANGCQTFTGATILGPGSPLALSSITSDKNCNGGVTDGEIQLFTEGGTAGYSYLWSNGMTTPTISNLDVGTYSVTVTDANNCQAVLSATINQPAALQIVSSEITAVDCNANATGAISVSVQGGSLPYTYLWSNAATTPSNSGLIADAYSVTVTDNKGCTTVGNYTVTEPLPLIVGTSTTDVDCHANATGEVLATVSGGVGGYLYTWLNGASQILSNQGADLIGMTADTYTVSVRDANGCTAQASATVNEPLEPLQATVVVTDINCFGDATGSLSLNTSGGTPGYAFNWSNGDAAPNTTGLLAGTYSVTIEDVNNCTVDYTFSVKQPDAPLSLSTTVSDVSCFAGNDGNITTSVSGGTGLYSYSWSNGATSANITDLIAGNYEVTVTDENGCTISLTSTVNEPAQPIALSSVVTDVACHGDNSGSIDLTVTGGTPGYTYSWSNSSYLVLTQVSEDLNNLFADTYRVLVEDSKGCIDSLLIQVNEPTNALAITSNETEVNCFGGADGLSETQVSGGTSGYSYLWSDGQTTADLLNAASGEYSLTVTDANGCQLQHVVEIIQPVAPLIGEVFTAPVKCFGEFTGEVDLTIQGGTTPYTFDWNNGATTEDLLNVQGGLYTVTVTDARACEITIGGFVAQPAQALTVDVTMNEPSCYAYRDGSIELTVTGGTVPYYFAWGDENEYLLNNPSEVLNNLPVNDYFYRVRDKNGCVVSGIVTVTQPDTISMDASIIPVSCFNGDDGEIQVVSDGGTLPYSYVWNSGQTTNVISNLTSAEYTVTMSDGNGCTYSESYFVPQASEINISSEVVSVTCIDQSDGQIIVQTVGGTQPYSWNWSTGDLTENVMNLAPGAYTLIVYDANNCSKTYDFIVPENNGECLTIVNTFTPNGDNYNDTWVIRNIHLYPEANVKVFNRWGNLIFESQGEYIPWDGSYKGEQLPSEVYYYVIVLNNNEDNKYTGTVTIVR